MLGSTYKTLDSSMQFGQREFIPHTDEPEPPARCKSCGVPFVDHLGLQGTCATVARVRALLEEWQSRLMAQAWFGSPMVFEMTYQLKAALDGEPERKE